MRTGAVHHGFAMQFCSFKILSVGAAAFLKIQLRCQVAVDIVAHGLAHEGLGDTEEVCQLLQLGVALGDGIV